MFTRLDHPGGNITGATLLASDPGAKRFGLFRDLCRMRPSLAGKRFGAQGLATLRVPNPRPALEIGCTLCSFNAGTRSEHYAAAHQGQGRTKA